MRDKLVLTQELIEQLPTIVVPANELVSILWKNIRPGGGMRLTKLGYDLFVKELKRVEYVIKLEPFDLDTRLVMALDRKLQHPYYIEAVKNMPTKLVLFDSKEAMLANLYGNLEKFLDNYS